jgi:adenosylcobyric acid synthase
VTATPIFIGGTSSNAGKSWMATAICAWLRSRGVAVAPFKAQTMSNNSYPCRDGGEIGRAQVAQAEACGLEPESAMNPILLKPNGDGTTQVIVRGQMWRTLSARAYHETVGELRGYVRTAYDDLARRFDVIVIEGAGSVSELNLRHADLVNLPLVTDLHAPWLLVADIERGGVFASIIGTLALLTPEERALFRGFAINKFRGDMSLFDEGVRLLEERTGAPCLGVFPHAPDIQLDAEDSLALVGTPRCGSPPGCRIAIVRLPCLSNATDFRLLDWAEWITVPPVGDIDFVVLPGSKSTIADLLWLRETGLADWIRAQHRRGATVIGICAGFQMLSRTVSDPRGVESGLSSAEGLALLPADTVLGPAKTTTVSRATTSHGVTFSGYEIHLGVTTVDPGVTPFARVQDGRVDGACMRGVIGTYFHGAFEDPAVCAEVFGVTVTAPSKQAHYRRLADWFEQHVRHRGTLESAIHNRLVQELT